MNSNLKKLTLSAMMLATLCVMSLFSLPIGISAVPLTLQTAGVLLCGILLGSKRGALCVACYLLLGAFGLPVFSGGKAGAGVLLGITGGFLFGFVVTAFIIGLCFYKNKNRKPSLLRTYIFTVTGIAFAYLTGIVQFSVISGCGLWTAFLTAGLPFLPLEAVKIALFVPLALRIRSSLSS